jgi:hypothetical protein
VLAWGALLCWVWISRWTVAPGVLYEWDSANYALGMLDFDIYQHQPHPPGYPLFTLLLRTFGHFWSSATGPFLMVNNLLSSAILLLMGWMLRRATGPLVALLAAAAFSVCPPFWYQGAVSTAYVAECFCSVCCMALALALVRGRLGAPVAALLLALVLGLRPSGLMSFTPLVLMAVLLRWPGWRRLALAAAAFCAGCAMWFVPLVLLGGGWDRYWEATGALVAWQRSTGGLEAGPYAAAVLVQFLLDGMNLLVGALALNLVVVLALWRRGSVGARTGVLLLAWVLPGALVYIFHHLAKSGYVLTLAPAGYVATGLALGAALPRLGRRARTALLGANGLLLAAYLVLNLAAFYLAVPAELARYRDANFRVPQRIWLLGDYGRLGLRYRTQAQLRLGRLMDRLDPDRDLVLFLFDAHELHRIDSYYHPRQWKIAVAVGHRLALQTPRPRGRPLSFGEFQIEVLRPPPFGPNGPGEACIHAQYDRLILARGDNELQIPLDRSPRRALVVFQPGGGRLLMGLGVRPVRRHRLGAGYGAWELTLPGLSGRLATAEVTAAERRDRCARSRRKRSTRLIHVGSVAR